MAYRGPLQPNCLLTRYPVCFLHGYKTLFNAFRYWKGAPDYLSAHGYQVFELAVPWRADAETRSLYLKTQLDELTFRFEKVHLIGRDAAARDIEVLLAKNPGLKAGLQSVSTISDIGPGLLQHCISLAEYDLTHAK
jgi:hypothetical protein